MFKEGQQEGLESERYDWGLAFEVGGETAEEARRLSSLISRRVKTSFYLDKDRIPHVTLFQGNLTSERIAEAQNIAREVLKQGARLPKLRMATNLTVRPNGNIWWNAAPSPELRQLHLSLNENLRPLTEGRVLRQFEKDLQNPALPAQHRKQLLNYGSLSAGERYLPHITLGRIVDANDGRWVAYQKPNPTELVWSGVVAGKLDEQGQFSEVSDIGSGANPEQTR